ncbi:MAG: F0F1 ATP synthase subunit delta [Gammaproteobacteria bacterium]
MNSSKIAQPYAKAAFEYARDHQQLEAWAKILHLLAECVKHPLIVNLLKNPQYSALQQADIFKDVLQEQLQGQVETPQENFIKTLAVYRRLSLLPQILQVFRQLRADAENTVPVCVRSAIELTTAEKQHLQASLEKKLSSQVLIQFEVDPALLGGMTIRIQDQVVDGSVQGQLNRLREAVTR